MPFSHAERPNGVVGERARAQYLALSGLQPSERALTLSGIQPRPHQTEAALFLRQFLAEAVAGIPERRLPEWWVALSSRRTGTGKSYLAFALAADLCRAGVPVLVVSEVEMMAQLRESQRPGSDYGIVQLRERWLRAPVLVLDDLCADKPSEFSVRELYLLIEARRRRRRPVIITTNRHPDGMQARYAEADADQAQRIVSRVTGMTRGARTWVRMEGPDLRADGEV